MSDGHRGYSLMYRLGFKPWEFDATPSRLIQVADRLSTGRALEVGCGSGRQAVELARRGWEVTGVDYVTKAIEEAKARADAAGVEVRLVVGDVTRLAELELGGPFDLVYDNKCFHGLPADKRPRYVEGVARGCQRGARYLLFALQPGKLRRLLGLPSGIGSGEVQGLFGPWFEILEAELAKQGFFEPAFYEMLRS
jgi:SAM-dependent methyltransferase